MVSAHMMMVNPDFAHPPEHPGLCLMELPPKDKGMSNPRIELLRYGDLYAYIIDSKAKAIAFQKQRAAELKAAYDAKIKAQEGAAPKSRKKHLFGH